MKVGALFGAKTQSPSLCAQSESTVSWPLLWDANPAPQMLLGV